MPRRRARALDVHLFEAPIGGGRGDIEEVREVERRLRAAGFAPSVHRWPPRSPPLRARRAGARAARAMTVASWWEVTCGGRSPGPLGAPGPWADVAGAIERQYGAERTVHVSLEEFARVLRGREQLGELWREGGVSAREARRRRRGPEAAGRLAELEREYRRFRGFARPNLVAIFPAWSPSPGFSREFPEAVVAGPLWPRATRRGRPRPRRAARRWLWYASPASADALVADVVRGLEGAGGRTTVEYRSPRPRPRVRSATVRLVGLGPQSPRAWRQRFRSADLRIVTGSRSLLEAVRLGGPFLYFNGRLGQGRRARRHRPEKIVGLLAVARRAGTDVRWRRALAQFSGGRAVASTVRWAARHPGRGPFPRGFPPPAFPPPRRDAGELVVWLARHWARSAEPAAGFVGAVRHRWGGRAASNS